MKKKIINDPLHGFISVESELVMEIISHPWFQRLRHIRQLGMADVVYPGAVHTRFQHALGAYHLMGEAVQTLRSKGIAISEEESEAVCIAILLHDIGHGPLSHALEETLLPGIKHESLTYRFLLSLNATFGGKLSLALQMFRDGYRRRFFHQLISGQIDIDRLDYLERDSFYTGVREGITGVERIIAMLNVVKDKLVVEEKAIYSLENFVTARRLMYWQVYLHKTAVGAERMLVNIMKRAQALAKGGHVPPCSPALACFLENDIKLEDFESNTRGINYLEQYSKLDDHDIWYALKQWTRSQDKVLSKLSTMLLERKIFAVMMSNKTLRKEDIRKAQDWARDHYGITFKEAAYMIHHGTVSNEAYVRGEKRINILLKNGKVADLAGVSDLPQIRAMSKVVKKNFICFPRPD